MIRALRAMSTFPLPSGQMGPVPLGHPIDSPRKSPSDVYANVGKQIKEGRHVGLDFYDLLIEALIDKTGRPSGQQVLSRRFTDKE